MAAPSGNHVDVAVEIRLARSLALRRSHVEARNQGSTRCRALR
jgi:hypothetical protein